MKDLIGDSDPDFTLGAVTFAWIRFVPWIKIIKFKLNCLPERNLKKEISVQMISVIYKTF